MNRKRSIGAAIGLTALLITSAAAHSPTGLGEGPAPAVTVARGSLLRVQNGRHSVDRDPGFRRPRAG
jgi:hypothetical protein